MANSACQEINVGSKRGRSSDEAICADGISRLPDVLIQHILSFLSTKEAMATSVLSKRWLWVWTWVPIIDLQDTPSCRTDLNLRFRFGQFVTRVLILNKMASLDKFCLKFNLVDHPSHVTTWFQDAVSRDVKELDITIHGTQIFPFLKLPFALFTARTLQVLKLSQGVELHVPGTVSLPCLKVLHLVWIKYMNDESVSRLFAGCHVLQELVLRKYVGDNSTISIISIPTLKIMSIRFATGLRKHRLKINAPILEHLHLEDNLGLEFDLEDVSSLVEANVSVTWLENRHIPLLKALCNTKYVSFNWDWYAKKNDNCRGFECRWKPPRNVPECLLSSLETVSFKRFEDVAYQLRMVKYILGSARVLKTMEICSDGDLPLELKLGVLKKLSMFPRRSKACQLQFN
ncbi:hypothetical protein V6N13_087921 [Hibiscus sabdariffa]|uniref:F-box domain-containing protein n=1 Tax=Hibiscus sabdariffa TaxID=183260 RepID=A0ABR2FXQ1_9ROSI